MNVLSRRGILIASIVLAVALMTAAVVAEAGFVHPQSSGNRTSSINTTTTLESLGTVTPYCENEFCIGNSQYDVIAPLVRSNTTQGIQLVLSIAIGQWANRTVVNAASAINNTLSTDVMLSSGEFDAAFPCGGQATSKVGVYAGFYTYANVTKGTPLILYNPDGFYGCPFPFPSPSPYNYTFHPGRSDVQSYLFGGYWVNNGLSGPNSQYLFHSFLPGWYTIVASNPWGQRVIGYFVAK